MFFVSKLLALLPFGNFIRGPFGKMLIGGAIVAAAVLGFVIWLASHDASIKNIAALSFNQSQLNKTIKDQRTFEKRMNDILTGQTVLLDGITKKRNASNEQSKKIIDSINTGKFSGGNSSEVLRETVRILNTRKK